MLDIFLKIFDSLFPPHESIKNLTGESPENFIRHFSPHRFANCFSLADYKDPIIKSAITANKFHDSTKAATLLSVLVEHWLSTLPPAPTIFIPIPLSVKRQKSRGYNQVTRVLENALGKNIAVKNILKRSKDTKPQTSLNRDQRFKNIEDAFVCDDNLEEILTFSRIVIIDDVVTTGATMHAAYNTLSLHLPSDREIICLALAH